MDKSKFIRTYLLLFVLLLIINCEEIPSSSNNDDPPIQTTIVSGQVILENQDEHSNCAIFDSALTILTGSDSLGNYSLDFKAQYPEFTGSVKLIYYLYDYAPDTANVFLSNGFVQSDTLSVNEFGKIDSVLMKQIILLKAWTSDSIVHVGDTITYTARFTNLTAEVIRIDLHGVEPASGLSFVSIVQGPFQHWYHFTDYPNISFELIFPITLQPRESYEGSHTARIPYGILFDGVLYPIPSGSYIMTTQFEYRDRDFSAELETWRLLIRNWDFHHRGDIPTFPLPQKFELPRIEVEN